MPTNASDLPVNGYGLTPVEMLVSEAGLGLQVGEIRGVAPEIAAKMIDLGSAKLYKPTKAEEAGLAKDLKDRAKFNDAVSARSNIVEQNKPAA